jgi:tetratricopeptide (TPR) repeat protein
MTFDICVGTLWFGRVGVGILCAVLAWASPAQAEKPREKLLAAKHAAYDANFQNDEKGLRAALEKLDPLATDRELGALALYYAGWTRWSLAAAQLQANEKEDAIASLSRSVEDLRKAVAKLPENASSQSQAEFQCQLASSLISLAVVDGTKMAQILPEVMKFRKQALELAPTNPRVVMMDAGMIFNTPAQYGGSQERGIERWLEAIRLFEAEHVEDALQPEWGRALAYGWASNLYLQMSPPRKAEAKEMASRALALRPDFWYVKTQILPKVS